MTTLVQRHRCDICGAVYLIRSQAEWCEKMCAEDAAKAIEAQRAETQKSGSVEDESAVRDSEFAQEVSTNKLSMRRGGE